MIKHLVSLVVLGSLVSIALPNKAVADRCATGRVTNLTATSISVQDREIMTFALDSQTHYTKWITQKPWQQSTRLDALALEVGQRVAVHPRDDGRTAVWIQIATDVR